MPVTPVLSAAPVLEFQQREIKVPGCDGKFRSIGGELFAQRQHGGFAADKSDVRAVPALGQPRQFLHVHIGREGLFTQFYTKNCLTRGMIGQWKLQY